jgi:hypothetical protein
MIEQHFTAPPDTPGFVEQTDKDTQNPVADSNSDAENASALVTDIQHVPNVDAMHETILDDDSDSSGFPRLDPREAENFRMRWNDIQGKFVDEPGSAVIQADALVSEVIAKITWIFTDEHSALKSQWRDDNAVSTEDLRQILQHYRSLFNRLTV